LVAEIKDIVKRLLLALPGFQVLCRKLSAEHVRVLMYHRFDDGHGDPQRLSAKHFSDQLGYISRHHPTWSADQHLSSYLGGPSTDDCPVVVTIDDGYEDFVRVAMPLLSKHKVQAILFVVTGFVSGELWYWWDKLHYALDNAEPGQYSVQLAGQDFEFMLAQGVDRQPIWSQLATSLSRMPPDDITASIARIARLLSVSLPDAAPREYSAASWEQLAAVAGSHVTLGAHTRTHPALSRVDVETTATEIESSRQTIIARFGVCSDVFCYPHGGGEDYKEETLEVVRKLNFSGAYVAFEPDGQDHGPFELRRYSINENWANFRWKLCGANYLVQKMFG